jgi:ABC-type sugar transport system ATPase subunit
MSTEACVSCHSAPVVDDVVSSEPVLRVRGLRKSFLGVEVLHGVDVEVHAGEVHGLVGENGAGKSTLMKIVAGVYPADDGVVELDGDPVAFHHPVQAQRAGISTLFQEFNLLVDRSVAENVFLGREPRRRGLVDTTEMARETARLLASLGVTGFSPQTRVRELSVAEQQIVEIVKAVSQDARVISMDEPTAALADHEVELLYRIIATLTDRGIAILYVSHRLREIFDLCDTITVLKDGALVHTGPATDLDDARLVRLMVGRPMSVFFPDVAPGTVIGEPRLQLEAAGNGYVDGVDLTVRGGEVVGVAGLQGSGRTELVESVFGVTPLRRGAVLLDGEPVSLTSPRVAVRAGLALVTEDRKAKGLSLNASILGNALGVVRAVFPSRTPAAAAQVPGILSSVQVAAAALDQEVQYLSGGNQQKVVLARWLALRPRVVLLDEPTRGIDVGAKHAIYELIRSLAAEGIAVLMVSSELGELLGMCDRIVVMRDGRVSGELVPPATEEQVLMLATGAGEPQQDVA